MAPRVLIRPAYSLSVLKHLTFLASLRSTQKSSARQHFQPYAYWSKPTFGPFWKIELFKRA